MSDRVNPADLLATAAVRVRVVHDLGHECLVLPDHDIVLVDSALSQECLADVLSDAVDVLASCGVEELIDE